MPQQNAETEFSHYENVQNDLIVLRNSISRAGQTDTAQFESVRLGTQYRERVLALNPPPARGTIATSNPYDIGVSCLGPSVETRFLEYQNGYNELSVGSIYYENSVVYLDERNSGGGLAVIEDQSLVTDDGSVRVTALQNDYRKSAVGRASIELYPTEDAGSDLGSCSGEIVIELPTRLSGSEYWNAEIQESLRADPFIRPPDDNAYSGSDVYQLRLSVSVSDLQFNTVGIDDAPEGETVKRIDQDSEIAPPPGSTCAAGNSNLPADAVAFDDANGNDIYDEGETTYTPAGVGDEDLEDVSLVIERDVSTDSIAQTVRSLTIRDDCLIETRGDLRFDTDDNNAGTLDASAATLRSGEDRPIRFEITKGNGRIDLRNTDVTAGDAVTLRVDSNNAGGIDARGAGLESANSKAVSFAITKGNGEITLSDADVSSAGGIDATIDSNNAGGIDTSAATLESGNDQSITFEITKGNGGIDLSGSELDSTGGISARIDTNNGGDIDASGTRLESANSKTIALEITKGNGEVSLTDADVWSAGGVEVTIDSNNAGGIDAGGATLESGNDQSVALTIKSGNGRVNLDEADVSSTGSVDVVIESNNAGGIDATRARFESDKDRQIRFEIRNQNGDLDLRDTLLVLPDSTAAMAEGDGTNRLFVNTDNGNGGTVVIDKSDAPAELAVTDMEVSGELERGTLND